MHTDISSEPKPKKIHHAAYPVYWVEAFNSAVQKWVTVDPLSTSTVDKPDKLEPPLSYQQSILSYVVAFEEDSVAKDITRKYAKAYNAKTRRSRVESTEGGTKWWKKALKVFKRGTILVSEYKMWVLIDQSNLHVGQRSSRRRSTCTKRSRRRDAAKRPRLQGPPCICA